MATGPTIVDYRGFRSGSRCGYCHGGYTKVSHGMWAHSMTVQDYQALIDRGWRRSGKYCYKPTMNETCCPQYAIKCAALDFQISKSQKKVVKRLNRMIASGMTDLGSDQAEFADLRDEAVGECFPERNLDKKSCDISVDNMEKSLETPGSKIVGAVGGATASGPSDLRTENSKGESGDGCKDKCKDTSAGPKVKKEPQKGTGADPSKPQPKKAKELRKERWRQKHGIADGDGPQAKKPSKILNLPKSVESLLEDIPKNAKHKLEVRLVRSTPCSEAFDETFDESYKVYKKYQMKIHGDPPDKPTQRQFRNFLVESPLQVRLCRSSPRSEIFEESLEESYNIFRRYQMGVHGDQPSDCEMRAFISFLVDSPLEPYYREEGFPDGYGSFHQQYLIDGKIVAVGVVDILPSCISSVYLYYDPDYFFLSLGTYTALKEVEFTRYLHTMEPSIKYYYMGYYIHSCPKMRYKGQYVPSFLLCPESYQWVPIEPCRPLLDANKFSRFDKTGAVDPHKSLELGRVMVLHQRQAMPYQFYCLLNPDEEDEEEVEEYTSLVGSVCAQRILLYRS